jgi:Bacterial Ig-like domain (group 2)
MRASPLRLLAVAPAILAVVTLVACQGGIGQEAFGGSSLGAVVDTVIISPSSATLTAIGAQQQFTATAEDSLNLPVGGVQFTWSSLDTGVVTVSSNGLARAVRNGTAGVVAQADGISGTASVTVSAPLGISRPARRARPSAASTHHL